MPRVWAEAKSCSPWLIALFLLCNAGAMVCRAARWQVQLKAINCRPSFTAMLQSIFGTYAVNLVFPRLGEIWRCSFMSRITAKPFSEVFGSMVADRLADILSILALVFIALCVSAQPMIGFLKDSNIPAMLSVAGRSPWVWLGICMTIAAIIAVFRSNARPVKALQRILRRIWEGFAAIFSMRQRGLWLWLTVAIWTLYFVSTVASLLAYPPAAATLHSHGLTAALITFVFGSLAMIIPSNGGIGPWQVAVIMSLNGIYLLPADQALAFATINLSLTTLLQIVMGIVTFVTIPLRKGA